MANENKRDYYEVLGIDKSASQDDIKKAFRKQARLYHPDLHPDDPAAEEHFKEVQAAYSEIMRIKQGGGNAGHNGLKSITQQLGTPNFWRLRLGIGHPRTLGLAQQVFDFVLSSPSAEHAEAIRACVDAALPTAELWAEGEMEKAHRAIAKYGAPAKPAKAS